jgi:serine/threonine-protein kinase
LTPRKIGTYELIELLGEGGIGQVYAARDTVLGRQVAIKMLRSELSRDRNFIARFYNEAQSLGDLSHPNITTLHALHLEGREPFMVMELVHGRTLEAVLERVHHLPLRGSLAIIAQAVAGLTYAHQRGVIHRDIKPANLMVTDTGLLKIMDFGIARVRGTQRLTRAGQMFGTLLYASPEQIRGAEVDERSDLYSLAVMFYEMLAGNPPFTAENDHALMTAHLETPPPPLTGGVRNFDRRVQPAVMRALAKRPEDRFASVEEFGRAVGATAIRGDATDILQDYLGSAFRGAPPPTRLISAHREAGVNRQGERADSPAVEDGPRVSGRAGRGAAMRSPIAVFGAVLLAIAIGLGYVALGPKRSIAPLPQRAALEPSRPAPLQLAVQPPSQPPTPSAAIRIEPSQPLPVSPTAIDPPKPPPAPPLPSAGPPAAAAPAHLILPASAQPDNAPTLLPWTPAPREPAALPTPTLPQTERPVALLEPPPKLKPDLQGTVSGVESSSRIRVGKDWIDLYGVNDPTQRAHTREVLGYLQSSRGMVECYQKAGAKYQCYADGKDLALLALRSGLARLAPDAPAEYRTVPAQPTSSRE